MIQQFYFLVLIQKTRTLIQKDIWKSVKHKAGSISSNIQIIRVPEGEEEEQEIENLLENIMKYFPNLAKEIDLQVQEVQRVPKKLDPRRNTPRHIIIKLPKIKDKERILKGDSYLQRGSQMTISWFLKRNLTSKKGLERRIWSQERQGPISKITLSSKAIILNGRADKVLPR